jgi:hypothetical protein
MDRKRGSSPELWLTPLIGLCLLAPMIWHWRLPLAEHSFAVLGDHQPRFLEKVALAVGAGVVPLLATAYAQRTMRGWKWPGWMSVLASGLIACLAVGVFYYYALYPPPATSHDPEGWDDMMVIYVSDVWPLGVLGGFAAVASAVITHWLVRRTVKA